MMIGTSLQSPKRSGKAVGAVKLRIDGLSLKSDEQFGVDLDAISLEVRTGEIVGIAGVAGNGQGELMQALIGERRAGAADAILIDGRAAPRSGARSACASCRRSGSAMPPHPTCR
jgi:simple sugar transport system ATP-binding protein